MPRSIARKRRRSASSSEEDVVRVLKRLEQRLGKLEKTHRHVSSRYRRRRSRTCSSSDSESGDLRRPCVRRVQRLSSSSAASSPDRSPVRVGVQG